MIDIKVTEKNFKFKLNKEALGKYMGIYFPEETQFLDILEVQMKKLENSKYCNKNFSSSTSLSYHIKHSCKHKDLMKDEEIRKFYT